LADSRDIFASHGLRCTRQRDQLYRALAATRSHPTAEELYESVRRDCPGLSLATVYNTLDAFCRVGLCIRLPSATASGPCRFDAETERRVHVALDDGRVLDAPMDVSNRILAGLADEDIRELERRMGVSITRVQLQMVAAKA
jgi:Fur family peroxide stress response transcriptional regulator